MAIIRLGMETDAPAAGTPQKFGKRERKLAETIRKDKNIDLSFQCAPVIGNINQEDGTPLAAESAQGQEIALIVDGVHMEMHHAVLESTGTAVYKMPLVSADGLEIRVDADVTDGPTAVELTHGITARSRAAFTVGTDPAFFISAKIKIDDISDLEELAVGFRKAEAYQADIDSYDELVAFHIGETGATVADGQINIMKILNNAATSYVDTTLTDWADTNEKTLRIEVDAEGNCTFLVDGSAPTVTTTFKFDAGEVVVPFIYVDNTAGSTTGDPGVSVSEWKVGKL